MSPNVQRECPPNMLGVNTARTPSATPLCGNIYQKGKRAMNSFQTSGDNLSIRLNIHHHSRLYHVRPDDTIIDSSDFYLIVMHLAGFDSKTDVRLRRVAAHSHRP